MGLYLYPKVQRTIPRIDFGNLRLSLNMTILRQFLTFSGVGIIGTVIHYLTLVLLVHYANIYPVAGSGAGFAFGAVVNYFLNYHVTFKSKKAHGHAMPRFFSVALVGLGLNTLIMIAGVELLRLHYLISQFIATGIVLLWNFIGNRFWTFKH